MPHPLVSACMINLEQNIHLLVSPSSLLVLFFRKGDMGTV